MSIQELNKIYSKHASEFLNFVEKIVDDVKRPESVVNMKELKGYVFDKVLQDLNLSKYAKNKVYNIVDIELMSDSVNFYGNDKECDNIVDIEDSNVDISESEKTDSSFIRNANIIYNKTLASTIWENVMIYGGQSMYSKLLDNIISDVEKINKDAAEKMKK